MSTSTAVVLYEAPPLAVHRPQLTKRQRRTRIIRAVCERIRGGALVADAAKAEGIRRETVWKWTEADQELGNMYARAREAAADALADEALSIAHGVDALGLTALELAEKAADDMDPDDAATFLAGFATARVARDRLRVDSLKWTAAKRRPKVYGDKVDVTSAGEKLDAPQVVVIGGRSITF